ncbi:MAG: SDR family oxidoreductase [Planctomycetota bacterium]|nr:SDR family oxidoreductase [Planctomycetota bacterium]
MTESLKGWAVILGASSGFGGCAAVNLARAGMDIVGVHLDRKGTLPNAVRIKSEIEGMGRKALFFNINASDATKRQRVIDELKKQENGGGPPVRVLFHSLAFGTLRPYVSKDPGDTITQAQMEMTMDVMANSLVYWVQDLVHVGLMGKGSRVFAMTSAGSSRIWPFYGAVSAAKAALESHTRQLAVEMGPMGLTANCLRAGVTDTPSLRKIPGHEEMIDWVKEKNPGGRLTTPEDVAAVLISLCQEGTEWCSGNVIGVDGGEYLV